MISGGALLVNGREVGYSYTERRVGLNVMERVILTGHAEWNNERLDFEIGPWAGGIGLMIRRTGGVVGTITGGGIWPSIQKAQGIAEETARRLLNSQCRVEWASRGPAVDE